MTGVLGSKEPLFCAIETLKSLTLALKAAAARPVDFCEDPPVTELSSEAKTVDLPLSGELGPTLRARWIACARSAFVGAGLTGST